MRNSTVKKQVMPKLRFSQFKGDLYHQPIKKIIDSNTYGPRFSSRDYDKNGNVKTIRGTDISSDGEIKYYQVPTANLDSSFIENHILADGDLVMITTADCGLCGIFREQDMPYIPSAYAVKIRFTNEAEPLYFKYFFQTWFSKREVAKYIRKATVSNLPLSDIGRIKLALPSKEEQRKVAEFLTSVDNWIESLEKQKKTLEEYKKGMIQKIFSQEIRFKDDDGYEYPEWRIVNLNNCLDYEQPKKYSVESTEYDDSYTTPVLTAGKTFILGYTNEKNGIFVEKLPVVIFDDFTTAIQYVDFPFKVKSSAMKILKPRLGFNIKFIFESMQNIQYETGGHGRHWISKYSKLEISSPSLEEQNKIASFLSSIDKLIGLKNDQIVKAKEWKKGLLQQMFV